MNRDEEIRRLEESMERLDGVDPDEIDPSEYGRIHSRLVKLRKERDSTPLPPSPASGAVQE